MADDIQSIVAQLRAARGGATAPIKPVPAPDTTGAFKSDATADMLRALGTDEATIARVAPGATGMAASGVMDQADVDTTGAIGEAGKLAQELGMGAEDQQRAQDALRAMSRLGGKAVNGLAELRGAWNDVALAAGEKASEQLRAGSTNLRLGMSMLDIISQFDNSAKLAITPEEKRDELLLRYLPRFKFDDPNIERDFGTATEAALWMAGQKMWGQANAMAAIPAEQLGRALGTIGADEAAAVMADLATRDRAVAQEKKDLVMGQVPQLVAGMAPMMSWQEAVESRFDPATMDDFYKWFQDHGRFGQVALGALAAGSAGADVFVAPSAIAGSIPTKAMRLGPGITKLVHPEAHAAIMEEIAYRSRSVLDAEESLKAARKVSERAQKAINDAVAERGSATPAAYAKVVRAQEAEARARMWKEQFRDPGEYESIMPRTQQRNPETLTMDDVEGVQRKVALEDGPDSPANWADPNMTPGEKTQRILLGPDDNEVTGDGLNLLVKGASIDDVTTMRMAPEYYVLPDVQTSLVDARKLAEAGKYGKAVRQEAGLGASDILDADLSEAHKVLASAKQAGDKAMIERARARIRNTKRAKSALPNLPQKEEFDAGWLPKKAPGIMQDPERHNTWLQVAGDRVIRSLYPGGINLHFWTSKLGQGMGVMREPQRYYSAYDPAAYERIRSSYMRYDQSLRAVNHVIATEGEAAGVLTKRSKFDMRKHFSPYSLNKEKDRQLFDLLDQPAGTDEFTKAYEAAAPELRRAHDRIRKVLDHYADLQGISGTDRYLAGYMRHVFDVSQFTGGARPLEYIGLPANAEVFASHLLERHGALGHERSAVLALDLYTRAANRKILLEPMYDDIIKTGTELSQKMGNTVHQTYANDLVQQLKGKPTFVGAKVDEWIGGAFNAGGGVKVPFSDKKLVYRPGQIDRTLMGLTSLVHTGLLSGNPTYPVIQIASGLTTTVGRYGIFQTSRGLWRMATKEGQQLAKAAGTYKPFVDIFESPSMRKYAEFWSKVLPSNVFAEQASRGITFNAAVDLHMRKLGYKSWAEAVEGGFGKRILFEALRSSEEVNHLYGPLGRSPWVTRFMGSAGSSAATQFLSFLPKQTEELCAQLMREPGRALQYFAVSGEIARQAASAGIDLTKYIGTGYLPETAMDVTSPAVDAAIANLDLLEALSSNNPDDVEKAATKFTKSLSALIPASQAFFSMSKAAERLKTGEVRDTKGRLVYPMQMFKKEGEGIGGEFAPTLLMQPNLREDLIRRGHRAAIQEDLRRANNTQNAIDHFLTAFENNDEKGMEEFYQELGNTSNLWLPGSTRLQQAYAARNLSQFSRSMEGSSDQQKAAFWKILSEHGVPKE